MGRGIGKTQRAILDALAEPDSEGLTEVLTVIEIASRLGISDRQARTAVRALESRGLVVVTKGNVGWKGGGGLRSTIRGAQPIGMPTSGLWVELPRQRLAFLQERIEATVASGGPPPADAMEEYRHVVELLSDEADEPRG